MTMYIIENEEQSALRGNPVYTERTGSEHRAHVLPPKMTATGNGEAVLNGNDHHQNESLTKTEQLEEKMKAHIRRSGRDIHNDEHDSFLVADLGEVYELYLRWKQTMGKIKPYYAVKVNPDPGVIRFLANLGLGFDCASQQELEQVLNTGVDPSRIIYANPCKPRESLRFAYRHGVRTMTFDGVDELQKIASIAPESQLILRVHVDDSSSLNRMSSKFGAPLDMVPQLLSTARQLNLAVVGISWHTGSAATDPGLFVQAVKDARKVYDQGRSFGFALNTIDVGGGFSACSLSAMADSLLPALDEQFPGEHFILIAEPGRYFVETAFTIACQVIARRSIWSAPSPPLSPTHTNKPAGYMLFLNDGVYGNFMDSLLSSWRRDPHILACAKTEELPSGVPYSIWGPTCDGDDKTVEDAEFDRELDVGDWLYFGNMGAYSTCLQTNFNGFGKQTEVIYLLPSKPSVKPLTVNGGC